MLAVFLVGVLVGWIIGACGTRRIIEEDLADEGLLLIVRNGKYKVGKEGE